MKQFLVVTLLCLPFVIGFAAIGFSSWPQLSTPTHKAALLKQVP